MGNKLAATIFGYLSAGVGIYEGAKDVSDGFKKTPKNLDPTDEQLFNVSFKGQTASIVLI